MRLFDLSRFCSILFCSALALTACSEQPKVHEPAGDKAPKINTAAKRPENKKVQDTLAAAFDTLANTEYSEEWSTDSLGYGELETFESEQIGADEYGDLGAYPEGDDLSEDSENLEVIREKLLQTQVIVVRRPDYRNTEDSVLTQIEKRVAIRNEAVSKRVIVEKWASPVNFNGYKFNQKKLVLYGVDAKDALRVYHYLNEYYLAVDQELYVLDESFDLIPFTEVRDRAIATYLLADENRL